MACCSTSLPAPGKTTIDEPLAHRLRSKFFLIDGTVISAGRRTYGSIQNIFAQSFTNAPSILFIDDCDLLFENEEETSMATATCSPCARRYQVKGNSW